MRTLLILVFSESRNNNPSEPATFDGSGPGRSPTPLAANSAGRQTSCFLIDGGEIWGMSFDEDDRVVLHEKHSEYDGQTGTVTQVVETMFGDSTYTVSFEDGQEAGIAEDALEPADGDEDDESDEE